jgi:hypothetical protein
MTFERQRAKPVAGGGVTRFLSRIAGNDDTVLAHLPAERTRAAALGGIVLGTALLSALEMYVMVHTINGGFTILTLVLVPAWFAFILSFDRLLMIKLSGSQWTSRLRVTAPRVALAILFGVVLSEPLLLTIFHTAIEERVLSDRAVVLSRAEAGYQRCNALDGASRRVGQDAGDCRNYLVNVATDVAGPTAELARTRQDLADRRAKLKSDSDAYSAKTERTRRECNGIKGDDVTGLAGVGPECRNFRQQQADFYRDQRIAEQAAEILRVQNTLPILEQRVRVAAEAYQRTVSAQSAQALSRLSSAQQEIGLLERMATFDTLRAGNVYLTVGTWLLRLFLIAIECAPVLVKVFSNKTAYDEVLDETLNSQRRIALIRIRRAELDTTYGDQLAVDERQQDLKDEQQKLRRRDRSRDLQDDLDLEDAIRSRAQQLRAAAVRS